MESLRVKECQKALQVLNEYEMILLQNNGQQEAEMIYRPNLQLFPR